MASLVDAAVFFAQGSSEIVVQSSGQILIEDGAAVVSPVVTDTTAATLANAGVSTIANATSALSTFILDAPAVGREKFINCDSSFGSTAIGYLDAGSGVTISSTQRYMSIKSAYATMHLMGLTTASWMLVAATGSTVSTGSTA